MQFKTFAISAFAATALGQSVNPASLLQVLQTALPSSLLAEASTNPAAVSSQLISQFAAGATPSWYSALPSDIQSALQPYATVVPGGNGTMNGTIINGNSTMNGSSTTTRRGGAATITTSNGGSQTSNGGSGSGGSGGSQTTGAGFQGSSSSQSGNAAPTAFIGAGLAGVVGLVGVLAL